MLYLEDYSHNDVDDICPALLYMYHTNLLANVHNHMQYDDYDS